jgi:predicted Zn-dependent protease
MATAPLSALPRARLAQVAFVRGEYRDAADRLREAIAAEPDWLLGAKDVQALYAEPDEFHDALAALEAHLQARPDDRDAWLVLGTQLLLSDRAQRAADVVLRLDDRRPDPLLSALQAASGLDR